MKKFVLVLLLGYMPFIQAQQITLKQLSNNTFIHTSYLQTDDFGHVPCNGLVIRDGKQAIVFETPTEDQSAKELIHLVPGHGEAGDASLLDYTRKLFLSLN